MSKNTVAELMREAHLVTRRKRRRRGFTKQDAAARKAPDLLQRNFDPPPVPNMAWVGDLTDVPNDEGPLFLATVDQMDPGTKSSPEIIGPLIASAEPPEPEPPPEIDPVPPPSETAEVD